VLVTWVVLGCAAVMIAIELTSPGRSWPKVAGWWTRALALNLFQAASVFVTGRFFDGWFDQHRLWSADALGTVGGALVGYVVHSFVYYWWHRWRHEVPFFWRWLHQVHHSPQRIEIITSFYKHPFEIFSNSLLSSAVLYLVVGLSPEAATGALLLSGLAELLYHWNVRTPYWLGFIIQRPESHCVHHQSGVHAFNYGDLPVFDWLFGTLRNPKAWRGECGLGAENEGRLVEMLAGVEVTAEAKTVTPGNG
jgi:sterol desaturase/sphingolipid hydroxylase (fatty acid hydroxylase superfamily)